MRRRAAEQTGCRIQISITSKSDHEIKSKTNIKSEGAKEREREKGTERD